MQTLHHLRRYDPAIDKALREMEAEARLSDQDSQHACEALTALVAYVAIVVAIVAAVAA